jgi:hypothetical protein
MDKGSGRTLVLLSLGFSVAFVIVAAQRKLTDLENVLLQIITLGLGLVGSYVMGEASARENAQEVIKPHAKSAFRRLLSLYGSLGRLLQAMGREKKKVAENHEAVAIIQLFEDLVAEQLYTSGDALEDWSDVVPEELAALKAKLPTSVEANT